MKLPTAELEIKPFLGEHFLLDNRAAEILYHEYASNQPIIDYHNHLHPADIASDKMFNNLTDIWLKGDHYKWRAMRTAGVQERYITGDATDREKFQKWAETVPLTIRNPLFHWTHLELQRYFGISESLNGRNAMSIYEHCNGSLSTKEFSTQTLLRRMQVEVLCTTDDPGDALHAHQEIRDQNINSKVLPGFRPDAAILIERDGFTDYIIKLGISADIDIHTFDDLLNALSYRIEYFHSHGCRLSDHGLEQIYAEQFTGDEVDVIFKTRINGGLVSPEEARKYMSAVLYHLCRLYAERQWVQQFHLGAMRNNNTRKMETLGPDSGFDSIGSFEQASHLAAFLDRLDAGDHLAKTILYNNNPADNAIFATLIGNFNDGSVRGKVQHGSAWWFLDQKDGVEQHLNTLSNMSLLSCFIGMITDSRSFLSFPRHEYFRRILCNLIGRDVHKGELPDDMPWLGGIVRDICYRNAKVYFDF